MNPYQQAVTQAWQERERRASQPPAPKRPPGRPGNAPPAPAKASDDPDDLTSRQLQALRCVRNRLLQSQPTSIRNLMGDLGYKSPRSVQTLIEELIDLGYLRRNLAGQLALCSHRQRIDATVEVPVLSPAADYSAEGLQLSECSLSLTVSTRLAPAPHTYCLFQAPDAALLAEGLGQGDLALVRLQKHAQAGDTVLILLDGKPMVRIWKPASVAVVLKAAEPGYPPIILHADAQPLGVLVAVLPAEVLVA